MTHAPVTDTQFAVCIHNAEYPAALELRKIYQIVPDAAATQQRLLRVIDESGEDYLYPADYFLQVELPQSVKEALLEAA
jgi:hypothetical protein